MNRADLGLIEANLKGSLIELRVARGGAGKSGGYRIILAYKVRDRAFFLYGFSKNDRAIIGEEEEEGYAQYGAILLGLTDRELDSQVTEGKLREIV